MLSFFYCLPPETAGRPLEEMNHLFTNALIFVPGMKIADFENHNLENMAEAVERKQSLIGHVEQK
jgi:hypothetical protein